jgi:hypothetical protein
LVTLSAAGRQNSSRDASSNVSVDQTSIGGTVVNSDGASPKPGFG